MAPCCPVSTELLFHNLYPDSEILYVLLALWPCSALLRLAARQRVGCSVVLLRCEIYYPRRTFHYAALHYAYVDL